MAFDYNTLELLRQNHPAWRLLCAKYAPLVAGFLHRVFLVPNVRNLSQADLVEALEDELFSLREQLGPEAFPGSASSYLNDWAENDRGWLRKFYLAGTDEPHFDLTPATEKALTWLEGLTERAFVGTESRLLTLFELLQQMSEGSQTDPQARIAELQKRRDDIDAEIVRILAGDIPLLDDTALKDRFQQFLQMARELLADFREVEHNFRTLDRRMRERIALWDGAKGELLEEIMGERDAIADSDQGKSFRAFWDFLMSQSRQEELSRLLEQVLALPPIVALRPDTRLQRVHYDWLEAGEHTQRTVARLSEQLRRFLDDQAWLENRRIMDILHSIENHALALREACPPGDFMPLAATSATVELPLERPLYRPPLKPLITEKIVEDDGDAEVDTAALYAQVVIDRAELTGYIRQELQRVSQISLAEVVSRHPLRHGLAELVAYLQLAGKWPGTAVDEEVREEVCWQSEAGVMRRATLPRIILLRSNCSGK
jgi:flagellar motility protein MotE (MotC chaperone)